MRKDPNILGVPKYILEVHVKGTQKPLISVPSDMASVDEVFIAIKNAGVDRNGQVTVPLKDGGVFFCSLQFAASDCYFIRREA